MTNRAPATANDRFKAAWGARVARGILVAGALHVVVIGGFPVLPAGPLVDAREHRPDLEWVVLEGGVAGDAGDLAVAAARAVRLTAAAGDVDEGRADGPARDHAQSGAVAVGGGAGLEPARSLGPDALRDYLRRRTGGSAGLVEVATGAGGAGAGAGALDARLDEVATERAPDRLRIGGEASTTGDQGAPGHDGLGLGRLSGIRPELAYHAPSPWILIQNPDDVEGFLQRRLRSDAASLVRATVSVAMWIDERGSVEWAEINRSSGVAAVDASVLELFSRVASYRPARERGVRVPIAVIFSLSLPL